MNVRFECNGETLKTVEMPESVLHFEDSFKVDGHDLKVVLPAGRMCLMYRISFDADGKQVVFSSNAEKVDHSVFRFGSAEPYAVLSFPQGADSVILRFELAVVEGERMEAGFIESMQEKIGPDADRSAADSAMAAINEIYNSRTWKMSKGLMKPVSFARRAAGAVKRRVKESSPIKKKYDLNVISAETRSEQESYSFKNPAKVSILVPCYNTPSLYLREMIDSVRTQTYQNWELCLADASDSDVVKNVVDTYHDERIVYKKLEENGGISRNSNAAFAFSTGEYIGLLDHDDLLHPSAVFDAMKRIEETGCRFVYSDEAVFREDDLNDIQNIHYKNDFSWDNMRAYNYLCHFSVFTRELFEKTGGFDPDCDGAQDFDLFLKLAEGADGHVEHIPEIRYFWRSAAGSTAQSASNKGYASQAGVRAVEGHLKRMGIKGSVHANARYSTLYNVTYDMERYPKVSVIIPNKNAYSLLKNCLDSIFARTLYPDYEIVIAENNSDDPKTLAYYKELQKTGYVKVVDCSGPFNFSAINNKAAKEASGELLLFLNNDIEVISPDWMNQMAMLAVRDENGCVGAKLLYPDNTVQHAGVVIGTGLDRVASHAFWRLGMDDPGYMMKMAFANDVMAVTGACLMVRKEIFDQVEGFDENLAVAYNDIDLCMKVYSLGKTNVFQPAAELTHFESISRGSDESDEKRQRLVKEAGIFKEKWKDLLEKGDPYYNPNFSKDITYRIDWL